MKVRVVTGASQSRFGEVKLLQYARAENDTRAGEDVELGANTRVWGDVVARGNLEMNAGAVISSSVTISGTLDLADSATIIGSVEEGVNIDLLPANTGIDLAFTSGTEDIYVTSGNVQTLVPGNYGTVKVLDDATLTLQSGEYYLYELETTKRAAIQFDLTNGPVVIRVVDEIHMGSQTMMSIISDTGSAADILFMALGGEVKFNSDGHFLGTYLAHQAEMELNRRSVLEGALYGNEIGLRQEATIIGNPALDLFISIFLPAEDIVQDTWMQFLPLIGEG